MSAHTKPPQPSSVHHLATLFDVLEYLVFQASIGTSGCAALRSFCEPAVERIRRMDADHISSADVEWFRGHVEGGCPSCAETARRIGDALTADERPRPKGVEVVAAPQPDLPADCQFVMDRLPDYLDDSLETQDWLRFTRHVRDCLTCFDLIEAMECSLYLAAAELRSRPDEPCEDEPPAVIPEKCDNPDDAERDTPHKPSIVREYMNAAGGT